MSAGGEVAIKIVGHADTRDIEAVRKAVAGLGPDFAETARTIAVEGSKADNELRKIESSAGGMGSALSTASKVAVAGIAALSVAAVGAAAGALSLVRSAEALGDAQARVGAVFGEEAAGVIGDNASIANSLGLTKTAYLDSIGAMGQYTTTLGLNKDAAADMAMGLTELAPKLAAYTGAEAEAVNSAFQDALAGKTKGLADLGIPLADIPKGLSKAAQAEFIYGEIMKKTANAQAEWVNNQGDVDNSMARLKSTFEDVKAKAGGLIATALGPWLKTAADLAADLAAAFDAGGLDAVAAKLDELTGMDVSGWLADARVKWDELRDAAKDFYDNQLVPFAGFLTGTAIPAVLKITDALLKNKDLVLAAIAVYATFKTALLVQSAITAVVSALGTAKTAWALWTAGSRVAALNTLFFGTSVKLALGPVGWILIAIGAAVALLAVAWKNNWGGIQEKTEAVVGWFKSIPLYFADVWSKLKADIKSLFIDPWAKIWKDIKEDPVKGFAELLLFCGSIPAKLLLIGQDIVNGLLNGMKNAFKGLLGWLKGTSGVGAIPRVIKGEMQSFSPSKVMIEIGYWIGEGLRLGIVKSWDGVVRTAQGLALATVDALAAFDRGGAIDAGKAKVAALIAQIQGLRVAFLTGGAAQEGSLAWLLQMGTDTAGLAALDFGALFASINVPVADVEAFTRLLGELVDSGQLGRAQELWTRFYDEIAKREEAIHEQRVKNNEQGRADALKTHTDARKLVDDMMAAEKRHFEWLKDQQAQEAAKPGGKPAGPKLEDFGLEVDRVEAAFKDVLAMLGNPTLADFWKKWNGDVNANITTTEDLGKAIDAIIEEVGKAYDDLQKGIEDGWDAIDHTEEERHNHAVQLLKARADLITTLLADQSTAEEALNALYAERERLLRAAEEAIKAAQKAAEEAESRVHAGVMAAIAAERAALTGAHRLRMILLEDERKAIDAGHERRLAQLQKQRDAVTKGFDERQKQIDKERNDLAQMKLDLGVEDALIRLTELQDKLNNLKQIMDSFKVITRGRDASEEARHRVIDRVKITSAEQRKAFEDVLASGTLNAKDARRVELLLLGRGSMKAEDMRRIIGASAEALQAQVDAQRTIVDFLTNQVEIRERMIERAETQLRIDREGAQTIIDGIDQRITAEDARWTAELSRNAARLTLEEQRFTAEMDFLDQLSDAEDDRHAKRMADIASEYALELAKLGMTQAQIDAMVAAAQAEAARIAKETEETFKRLKEAAGGGLAEAGGLGLSGAGGGGLKIPSIGTMPTVPMPGGSTPIIGLKPGGGPGGGMTFNITTPPVTVKVEPVPVTDVHNVTVHSSLVVGGQTLAEFDQQVQEVRNRRMLIGGGP